MVSFVAAETTSIVGGTMNDIQRRLTYNTCLICGIRTSQLVNIFEEGRGGPNLVDVIYEKYNIKVRFLF